MAADDPDSEASRWIARRDGGLTAAEEAALAEWLAADPAHAAAWERCEAAWQALPRLRALPAHRLAGMAQSAPRTWPVLAIAAALAAIVVIDTQYLRKRHAPAIAPAPATAAGIHFASARGETRILPDGSVAELHAGSEIAWQAASARQVDLVRGEALFTVARAHSGPAFVVHAGPVAIEDLGTAFDVRLEPGGVSVLVTQGRVRVTDSNRIGRPVLVAAGEQALIRDGAVAIEVRPPTPADARRALAWKDDRLVFTRTPLAHAVAEMNLCNNRKLVVADPQTGDVAISGSVNAASIEAFLALLRNRFDIVAEDHGSNQTLLHRLLPVALEKPAEAVLSDTWVRFTRTPLSDAIASFNSRHRAKLIIGDADTGNVLISGRVDTANLDGFLGMLSIGFGVRAETRPDGQIVLHKSE